MQADKTRILFVDDDVSLLAGLRRMLHRWRDEWDSSFCSSGREALQLLDQGDYHVIVSDIRMPEMDGVELMQRTQSEFPQIVRFILSGQAEQEKVMELTESVHQYFSKPCNPDTLRAAITRIRKIQKHLDSQQLIRNLTAIKSIPLFASKYEQLKSELEQTNASLETSIEIIKSDIGLTMKVLQLANSHFFGERSQGSDVEAACRKLGLESLKSVFVKATLIEVDSTQQQTPRPKANDLANRLQRHWPANPSQSQTTALSTTTESNEQSQQILSYLAALWGIELPALHAEISTAGLML